ncbi:antitoxin VapB [Blastococcus colisei]|uniref:Antitoxin VapB n=1 Tax=Blastococcus colisei TaxID=1564162 RepID=A0A543P1K4_9ACTN|nr:type II toxin-antitoxin system VapB family antitoxin [Blastococcus colisei]TQN37972.1 antitoxin VapB [Blastococcus colisei]
MALSIKTDEADQLARALAAETQESLTEAVTIALRERLARVREERHGGIGPRLDRLTAEYARLPLADERSADEIIGYDVDGLPT